MIALLFLLAAADIETQSCPVVQRVLKAAPSFSAVKGKEQKTSSTVVRWTKAVRLPLATRCMVIEHKDGSPSFWGCNMHATTCKLTEAKYDAFVAELDGCLPAKHAAEDEGPRRTARWRLGDRWVRTIFKPAEKKKCGWDVFVEVPSVR